MVSIVIPVKNESQRLPALLDSIRSQHYQSIEVIVVDNFSTDETPAIGSTRADVFVQVGPERSAQRNAGWQIARGRYVLFLDADMVLTAQVISACVAAAATGHRALFIPERSFGVGFWAECKALERECYVGDESIEAARFFDRCLLEDVGGYDESLVGFEDWDLTRRVIAIAPVGRISEYILHDEGRLRLLTTIRKKMYYARDFATFVSKHGARPADVVPIRAAFLRNLPMLARRPIHGLGVIFMKTAEFSAGGLALAMHLLKRRMD